MKIIDLIHQGGFIMYLLVLLNIVGYSLMIYKFITLYKEQKNIPDLASDLAERISKETKTNDANALIELGKQEIAGQVTLWEKGLNTIKIIASVSPLLGLLGTVLGVLLAFRVMSETGLNDPSNFAKGISLALVTTVGGLIVAIPHFIGHSYLLGVIDKIESKLEQLLITKIV